MAVKRVVLQHMSLNLAEDFPNTIEEDDLGQSDEQKEEVTDPDRDPSLQTTDETSAGAAQITATTTTGEPISEKRKFASPFGLSPPSESRLLQRRRVQSQSLHQKCSIRTQPTPPRTTYITSPSCC